MITIAKGDKFIEADSSVVTIEATPPGLTVYIRQPREGGWSSGEWSTSEMVAGAQRPDPAAPLGTGPVDHERSN